MLLQVKNFKKLLCALALQLRLDSLEIPGVSMLPEPCKPALRERDPRGNPRRRLTTESRCERWVKKRRAPKVSAGPVVLRRFLRSLPRKGGLSARLRLPCPPRHAQAAGGWASGRRFRDAVCRPAKPGSWALSYII